MSVITQCPECGTRFKASAEQLEVRQGMVRCGHCRATFDATQHLYNPEPSPQLDLPIEPEPASVQGGETPPPDLANADQGATQQPDTDEVILYGAATAQEPTPANNEKGLPVAPRKSRGWVWAAGSLLMLVALMAQATYYFRVDLAARLPGLKPALNAGCAWLKCSIPLPQDADLLSIESSSLEVEPQRPNVVTVNILLRNHAPYAQAYPRIALAFTDTSDEVLARRILLPEEYLEKNTAPERGLGPRNESALNVHLDTGILRPSGYRLQVFYPL